MYIPAGAFYPVCHVQVFSKAFEKEEAPLLSWSQQKIHGSVILELVYIMINAAFVIFAKFTNTSVIISKLNNNLWLTVVVKLCM